MGEHRPVDLEPIRNLDGLPHSRDLREFKAHLPECECCDEAHASGRGICREYCPEGHKLVHKIEAKIIRMAHASVWN